MTKEEADPQSRRQRKILGPGIQADDRPVRGPVDLVRVYSGVLTKGDTVYNAIKGKKERDWSYRADARQRAPRN